MREQCGEGGDGPPELPPRPPHLLPLSPRPPAPHAPAYSPPTPGDPHHCTVSSPWYSPLTQKYVLLTLICGGLSVVLGALFMAIYLTVKSTTTSLHYFQTIPTYVPAIAVCTPKQYSPSHYFLEASIKSEVLSFVLGGKSGRKYVSTLHWLQSKKKEEENQDSISICCSEQMEIQQQCWRIEGTFLHISFQSVPSKPPSGSHSIIVSIF